MASYKALDVREIIRVTSGSSTNHSYGGSNSISLDTIEYVVCIAKDLETGNRVRFEFKRAYKDTFMGKTYYYGYTGDYHLLVPGDTFELEDTNTYMHLTILDNK